MAYSFTCAERIVIENTLICPEYMPEAAGMYDELRNHITALCTADETRESYVFNLRIILDGEETHFCGKKADRSVFLALDRMEKAENVELFCHFGANDPDAVARGARLRSQLYCSSGFELRCCFRYSAVVSPPDADPSMIRIGTFEWGIHRRIDEPHMLLLENLPAEGYWISPGGKAAADFEDLLKVYDRVYSDDTASIRAERIENHFESPEQANRSLYDGILFHGGADCDNVCEAEIRDFDSLCILISRFRSLHRTLWENRKNERRHYKLWLMEASGRSDPYLILLPLGPTLYGACLDVVGGPEQAWSPD